MWQKQATLASDRPPMHVEFWRGGTTLVMADGEGNLSLWDVPTRRRMVVIPANQAIDCVALGFDDRTIATSGPQGITIRDAATRAGRKLEQP